MHRSNDNLTGFHIIWDMIVTVICGLLPKLLVVLINKIPDNFTNGLVKAVNQNVSKYIGEWDVYDLLSVRKWYAIKPQSVLKMWNINSGIVNYISYMLSDPRI